MGTTVVLASVWIPFLRRGDAPFRSRLIELIGSERAALIGLVYAGVMQGVRTPDE